MVCDILVLKACALDAAGAVGAGFLHVDQGYIDLRGGHEAEFAAGMERVIRHGEFLRRQLRILFSLLFGDAPYGLQVASQHVLDRHVGKAQRCAVVGDGLHVQGVVLHGERPLFHGFAETPAHHGKAGVGDIADIHYLDASGADEHVDIAAGAAALDGEIFLFLPDDLPHQAVGPAVRGKAAERDAVPVMDEACDGVLGCHEFVLHRLEPLL